MRTELLHGIAWSTATDHRGSATIDHLRQLPEPGDVICAGDPPTVPDLLVLTDELDERRWIAAPAG